MTNIEAYPLNHLPLGGRAHVWGIAGEGRERRRLLDLGLTQGTVVEAVQKSPSGDPIAYFFRGAVIALRAEDAAKVLVREC